MGAVTLSVKLIAIYGVWLSVLKLLEKTGVDKRFSNLLRPVVKRLFKGENDESQKWITLNLASNMLGMGGASTPAGIKAMECMEDHGKTTKNMNLLVVINATCIQLIPTTVIAIRASSGSVSPSSIIAPTLVASTVSTAVGIVLVKLFGGEKKPHKWQNGKWTVHGEK